MGILFWSLACSVMEIDSDEFKLARASEPQPPDDSLRITYEIYVRSFYDSDGDGTGDLAGVTEKLPYLDELGVETLWLMPIFEADAVAGYGVVDHTRVADEYGSTADLSALVEAAHARGMRVLLDFPFNHVSRRHAWFVGAQAGVRSDRFIFAPKQYDELRWFPAADGTFYYGFFGAALPDLDWTSPALKLEMIEIMRDWLDVGVDGFRLDAANTLIESAEDITNTVETHTLLAELRAALTTSHPHAVLLAEAGESDLQRNLAYLGQNTEQEADYVLDFPRRSALLDTLAEQNPTELRTILAVQGAATHQQAVFLGSHDVSRLASTVASPAARRALMAALFSLPGQPLLYYGEELDLVDSAFATGQDYAWRAPMPWSTAPNAGFTVATDAWMPPDPGFAAGQNVEDESGDEASMLRWVHQLAELRLTSPALSKGSTRYLPSAPGVLSVERIWEAEVIRVEINFSSAPAPGLDGELPGFGCTLRTGTTIHAAC